MRLTYLKILRLLNSGTPLIYSGDSWHMPGYPDATIVGNTLMKKGLIKPIPVKLNSIANNMQYFTISEYGKYQLELGNSWWREMNFANKILTKLLIR